MTDPTAAPKPRRFYASAGIAPHDSGFSVRLDGRGAKTPGGNALAVPTEALARLLADEWAAQADQIDMNSMPANRVAFTAIDRTPGARRAMAEELARYAGADLLCYPAEAPRALVERQARDWGPWLAWAGDRLGMPLTASAGVAPVRQPEPSLERARRLADELDDFSLTGLVMAAGLYGSAVLALAVARGDLDAVEAFELSRLDEAFQEEQWGVDAEAEARTLARREDARILGRWFSALAG